MYDAYYMYMYEFTTLLKNFQCSFYFNLYTNCFIFKFILCILFFLF